MADTGQKTLKRINALIKDIQRSPYQGIGKPEPLRGNLSGWWSRRIDETNRIVYYEQGEVIYRQSRTKKEQPKGRKRGIIKR